MTVVRSGFWGYRCDLFVVLAGLIAGTLPAAASGGIWCHLEDQSVRAVDRERRHQRHGRAVLQFPGKLEILDASVPEKLRTVEFEQQNLAQYWLDGRALKLHLYREWEVDKSFDMSTW